MKRSAVTSGTDRPLWRTSHSSKEREAEMVWACFPLIWSRHDNYSREQWMEQEGMGDKRRDGKIMWRNGQDWVVLHLRGQLKLGQSGERLSWGHHRCPMTIQIMGQVKWSDFISTVNVICIFDVLSLLSSICYLIVYAAYEIKIGTLLIISMDIIWKVAIYQVTKKFWINLLPDGLNL